MNLVVDFITTLQDVIKITLPYYIAEYGQSNLANSQLIVLDTVNSLVTIEDALIQKGIDLDGCAICSNGFLWLNADRFLSDHQVVSSDPQIE